MSSVPSSAMADLCVAARHFSRRGGSTFVQSRLSVTKSRKRRSQNVCFLLSL